MLVNSKATREGPCVLIIEVFGECRTLPSAPVAKKTSPMDREVSFKDESFTYWAISTGMTTSTRIGKPLRMPGVKVHPWTMFAT